MKIPRYYLISISMLTMSLPALGQDAEPVDFKGKAVILYIGYGAGGGNDLIGRLAARNLGRHLPGSPNVVPQNMPGAGTMLAANYIFNAAPKDGTAIGQFSPDLPVQEMLGARGVQYRANEFNWIGRVTTTVEVHVTSKEIRSVEDARSKQVVLAGSGVGSGSETYPALLNALGGTKFRVISGYTGAAQGMLATERGEVDGFYSSWNTMRVGKIKEISSGALNILIQYGLKRHPELPNVPSVPELAVSDRGKQILTFFAGGTEVGISLAAPPGTPGSRIAALRKGFDEMRRDPAFVAEFSNLGIDLASESGAYIAQHIRSLSQTDRTLIDETRRILFSK